jgi:PAS domain S-box-containing protein
MAGNPPDNLLVAKQGGRAFLQQQPVCPPSCERARPAIPKLITAAIFIFAVAGLASSSVFAQGPTKRVLLLHSEANLIPVNLAFDQGITKTMSSAFGNRIFYFNEFLDTLSFSGTEYELRFKDYLRQKYAQQKLDLIIATGPAAAAFLGKYREELFGPTPVVFCAIAVPLLKDLQLGSKTTGVAMIFNSAATLSLALKLQPEIKRIVVVSGASPVDEMVLAGNRIGLTDFEGNLEVKYLGGLTFSELKQQLGMLKSDTIVLYTSFFRDGAGTAVSPEDALQLIASYSSVPVYGSVNTLIGLGIVGGSLTDLELHAAKAASLGVRILNGESPDDIPVVIDQPEPLTVDWRQLKRWRMNEARVPPGTIVRFREFTFWELYKWRVMGVLALCALETSLIAALLVQRRKRALVTQAMARSEQRIRSIIDNTSAVIYLKDEEGRYLLVNKQFEKLFSLTNEDITGKTDFDVFPADVAGTLRANDAQVFRSKAPLEFEEAVYQNGQTHTYVSVKVLLPHKKGRAMCGISTDITARKDAEAELQRLREELTHYGRVAAMGELTASIAHELNQPLTAILSNAQAAQRFLQNGQPDLAELGDIVADVIADDRRASEVIQRLRALLKRGDLQMVSHDINALINEVRSLINSDLLIKDIAITLDLDPTLPSVRGDRVQLQQVILNILINAMDALSENPRGHRHVVIRTFRPDPGEVQVDVVDSGSGISKNDLTHVFESFYTTKSEGLGMGLSISRSIIERHGGRVWATNNSDRGATFHLTVPVTNNADE